MVRWRETSWLDRGAVLVKRRRVLRTDPPSTLTANALIWDTLKNLCGGRLIVEVFGQPFEMLGNPWGDEAVGLYSIGKSGLCDKAAPIYLVGASRPDPLAGSLWQGNVRVGNLSDVRLILRGTHGTDEPTAIILGECVGALGAGR